MPASSRLRRSAQGLLVASLVVACSGEPDRWLAASGFNRALAAPGADDLPASTAGAFLVGQYAFDQGDYRTAIEQFQIVLRADPESVALQRQVLTLQIATGQFSKAAAERLVALDPHADEGRLLLALTAVRDRDYGEALGHLDQLDARGIASIIEPVLRAWVLYGDGRKDEATTLLEGAARDDGFESMRVYHLATMLALRGRHAQARTLLEPLVQPDQPAPVRLTLALAWIEAAAGDRQAAARTLSTQAGLFDENFLIERALARVEAGQKLEPLVEDTPQGIADALVSLGAALQEQGLNAQAILYGRLATLLDPQAGDAWLLIAGSTSAQGHPQGAVQILEKVPESSAYAWSARLTLARALEQAGDIEQAVGLLEDMAKEQPRRVDALVALGDMLRAKERYAEAETAYSEAIARLPELRDGHWRLLYARGITYERTDRWPQAERDFEKALELEPEQPFVLNYLGYSWVDRGEHLDEAKAMLRRAVELRPQDGFIVDSLGWAFYRLGDYDKAVDYLERAIELQPGDPVINEHLGDAYWRVGREREARYQWRRALTLDPEQSAIAGIEDKLSNGLGTSAKPDRG